MWNVDIKMEEGITGETSLARGCEKISEIYRRSQGTVENVYRTGRRYIYLYETTKNHNQISLKFCSALVSKGAEWVDASTLNISYW